MVAFIPIVGDIQNLMEKHIPALLLMDEWMLLFLLTNVVYFVLI